MNARAAVPPERPLVLTDAEVRALAAGQLAELRRPVGLATLRRSRTPGYDWTFRGLGSARTVAAHRRHPRGCWQDLRHPALLRLCPFGAPGDALVVREAWASPAAQIVAYRADAVCGAFLGDGGGGWLWVFHGFVTEAERLAPHGDRTGRRFGLRDYGGRWRPAAQMPRWAARHRLVLADLDVVPRGDGAGDGAWDWRLALAPHPDGPVPRVL